MIFNQFPLLPDEHLYSWLVRQYWLSGYPSFQSFELSHGRNRHALKSQQVFNNSLLDVAKLAAKPDSLRATFIGHSHLTMWDISLSESSYVDDLDEALANHSHMNEQLMFNFTTSWMSCLECRESDLSRYGSSYWHLSHQIPSVICCEKHNVVLEVAENTFKDLAVGVLPHQVDKWKKCSGRSGESLIEWSEFLFIMHRRCKGFPSYGRNLRLKILKHLGVTNLRRASLKRLCKELSPSFEDKVGSTLLEHLFRTHAKPGQKGKVNVLSALFLNLNQSNGVRNPIYWYIVAYWLRDEIDWNE